MGEIYLCVATEGDRLPVALKSFPRRFLFDPAKRRAFQRECAVAIRASLAIGVLPVYGLQIFDGRPFIAMQAVLPGPRGEVSLRDLLRNGPLSLAEAAFFARFIARALASTGQVVPGLIHGDLKPENLLMVLGIPYIADFGIAQLAATQPGGDTLGTPEYRAPEADDPNADLSIAADIYSYGVILTEMLTGRRPQRGKAAAVVDTDPTVRLLLDLAEQCRISDPAGRPTDFTAITDILDRIVPGIKWPAPETAIGIWAVGYKPMLNALRRSRVAQELLHLQEYDMVLDYVAATAEDSRDWVLWTSQGTALSLTGRDEEALVSYERAYRTVDETAVELTWQISLEAAASLKRLRRFDEAEQALNRLIETAPDEKLMSFAVGNLAALYIDTRRHDAAEILLHQLAAKFPENTTVLANYAVLRREAGDTSGAADLLRQAIRADPGNPELHDRLARQLMDELGLIREAAAAFDRALDCGSLDAEVMFRALACALVLGDVVRHESLRSQIASAFGPDVAAVAEEEARVVAFWLTRKFGGPEGPAAGDLPPAIARALHAIGLSDPLTDNPPVENPPHPPWLGSHGVPSAEAASDARREDGAGREFWHLQCRLAVSGFMYIDVYGPFDAPDYIEQFLAMLQHGQGAQAQASQLGNVQIADTPFLLLRCPKCSAELASNRLEGSSLTCQRCRATVPVIPQPEPTLDPLRSRLAEALGMAAEFDGWELLLVLQPAPALPDVMIRKLTALLEQYAVTAIPTTHSGALITFGDGISRGLFRTDLPWLAGVWRYPPGSVGSSEKTPEMISRLIDEARRMLIPAQLSSISCQYDVTSDDAHILIMQNRLAELEDRLRARPSTQADASLWVQLGYFTGRQDLTAGARCAQAATAADPAYPPSWHLLGEVRLAQGDPQGALRALERAHQLDPGNGYTCRILALCYGQLGRDTEARAMEIRARSLGG